MIVPTGPESSKVVGASDYRSWGHAVGGCGYLVLSSLLGIYFLSIVRPSVANDLWWRDFTTGGPQTFLADVFHRRLQLEQSYTVSLFAPEIILEKEYSSATTFIDMSLSLSRQVLLANISLPNVVESMRQTTFAWNVRMFTQYCWVDFGRVYELSITAKRQTRCAVSDSNNAAAFWEPLLRNSNQQDVLNGSYATALRISIFNEVLESSSGRVWMDGLWATPWLPVTDEVAVWSSHGLTRWQTEVTNYYEQGLQETYVIVNALGIRQRVTIHLVAQSYRGLSIWTLVNAYAGVWNDLFECQAIKCSLIRGADSYSDAMRLQWESMNYGLPIHEPRIALVDRHMGPYGTIDLRIASKPRALEDFYLAFEKLVLAPLFQNASRAEQYMSLPPLTVDVAPTLWRGPNMSYFGGNPMCISHTPQLFVQDQFNFYDSCSLQQQSTMKIARSSLLFATAAFFAMSGVPDISSICIETVSASSRAACLSVLSNAHRFAPPESWVSTTELLIAMGDLDLTMIQLALNGSTPVFLTQPLVATRDPWSFFGWAMVYDWLQGDREAFAFHTDAGLHTVLSSYLAPTHFPANPLELPQQACTYVWIILVYSGVLLTTVAVSVVVATIGSKLSVCGRDLLHFHRVASPTWVGRPFLFLRGFTALTILSTSPVDFVSAGGVSHFRFAPRSALDTMVLASEATWVTYVLVDFVLPVAGRGAYVYAPLSCAVAWLIIVLWETVAPYEATLSVQQTCHVTMLGLQATCSGGSVEIGSPRRLIGLASINVASTLVALVGVRYFIAHASTSTTHIPSDLLPASAQAFFTTSSTARWHRDPTTTLMAGMVPLSGRYFHVNLWQIVHLAQRSVKPKFSATTSVAMPFKTLAVLGILYVVFSVVGSFAYIYLSATAMTNDFWWANFNSTGHQTFLTNWFTTELQFGTPILNVDLTVWAFSDSANLYNTTDTFVRTPSTYATMVQDEVNTLPNVIAGLRAMDGCDVPWIATYYCYADFNRTWEMAVSSYRQERCASADSGNGAVYLESYLRNVNWAELLGCWESSLEGRLWLDAVRSAQLPLPSEVAHWQQRGISVFVTQWQNYKSLGVLESFTVQNAFGIEYPMSLKYSNGSLHSSSQTSFKMQWPLASQLWAVGSNATIVAGSSLMRQSPAFVYSNISIGTILAVNGTLELPLDAGFSLFNAAIGPFGTITMRRVAFPPPLVAWSQMLQMEFTARLAKANVSVYAAFDAIGGTRTLVHVPQSWGVADYKGGDITCPVQPSQPYAGIFYSAQGACGGSGMEDSQDTNALMASQALLAEGPSYDIVTACNDSTMGSAAACGAFLSLTQSFLQRLFTPEEWTRIAQVSEATKTYIQTTLPIVLVQYVGNATHTFFRPSNLFDPVDPGFHVFGWLYLVEWLQGVREVVEFAGAAGALNIVSGRNPVHVGPVNALEIPVNVAYYFRCVLLYVSGVLFLVACIASGYIISSRGRIEGTNMFSLNRVTGLVWIGRPLVCLRGITAICLLSTAKLDLEQSNGFFRLVSQQQSWFTTVMAAGETTWLVFILNDCFSILTQQYTSLYAAQSSILIWVASATWSILAPVQHRATLQRSCSVIAVDAQIVCRSGVVTIGDINRLLGLVGLASGLIGLCYGIQRLRFPAEKDHGVRSHLLYATAYHHFRQDGWVVRDVYHVDRASAAIDGLLTWRLADRRTMLLDIKTWRLFTIDPDPLQCTLPSHLRVALPIF
ncbi:hypothetical protein ACHHYP_05440 [Achlya hypogyna]|uniref:Transmembrane protein n=1 Tax=Achlya hypogyna TaxID=1202772 RepID=A0A1V9YXP5_ACHHY|nr:hypothetical protein ACHHYP_05440 [Achlya hypogyna]